MIVFGCIVLTLSRDDFSIGEAMGSVLFRSGHPIPVWSHGIVIGIEIKSPTPPRFAISSLGDTREKAQWLCGSELSLAVLLNTTEGLLSSSYTLTMLQTALRIGISWI